MKPFVGVGASTKKPPQLSKAKPLVYRDGGTLHQPSVDKTQTRSEPYLEKPYTQQRVHKLIIYRNSTHT